MKRIDGRAADELRRVKITKYFQRYPAGSVLIEMGRTRIICAASVEDRVPYFLRGTGTGWIKAEYALLPSATSTRTPREACQGRQSGRTQEIQRLIGRALRAVVDTKALGERTIHIDCDVLQADGGTRTASITGAFVALVEACASFYTRRGIFPVRDYVAAVSVGISSENIPLLDLCYEEDSAAMVDMNLVMTGAGTLVEVQGTGEGRAFSRTEMNALLDLGEGGIRALIDEQKIALGETLAWMPGREG